MRPLFAVALLIGSAALLFSPDAARAFNTSPYCAGSFGYGSDGKLHCDVARFNADKKAGKKYKYDPAKAGKLKDHKDK
jgi:hypothetical protein